MGNVARLSGGSATARRERPRGGRENSTMVRGMSAARPDRPPSRTDLAAAVPLQPLVIDNRRCGACRSISRVPRPVTLCWPWPSGAFRDMATEQHPEEHPLAAGRRSW